MKTTSLCDQLLASRADRIPKGWVSVDQLAKEEGLPSANYSFQRHVKEAVKAGILKLKVLRVAQAGQLRRAHFYRRVKA